MNRRETTRLLALLSITLVRLAGEPRAEDLPAVEVEPRLRLEGHGADVYGVAFSPDAALLATGSFDRTARLWDVESGAARAVLAGHDGKVMALAFSPDGTLLATGSQDQSVRIWSVPPGLSGDKSAEAKRLEAAKTLTGHKSYVQAVAFAPGGDLLASAGGDKTLRLWTVEDGKEQRAIEAHASSVYCVGFSPDGKRVATGGLDTAVKVWNVADGKELAVCSGHLEGVFALCFSADGRAIYSGSADRTLRKWNAGDGKEIARYERHPGWISGFGLLPGEKVLVSADYGGHVVTWDLESGRQLAHRRLRAVVFAASVSPDGRFLALGGEGGAALLGGATPE